MAGFTRRLEGATVAIFIDFQFEDLEVMYPKVRLLEEGCRVVVIGAHPAGAWSTHLVAGIRSMGPTRNVEPHLQDAREGQKYTGKHGYPVKSDLHIDDVDFAALDGIILPGGFAPDYMRRNVAMLQVIAKAVATGASSSSSRR